MCGFRDPIEIYRLLGIFLDRPSVPAIVREGFVSLLQALQIPDTASALRNFLSALFSLPPEVREALPEFILMNGEWGVGSGEWWGGNTALGNVEWELMQSFARLYPGDPAVIAPLYLNVFHLEPGEAIFLDAGLLHAYVHGFGVELMANSDNVLRGGLTAKHIDISELMNVLEFRPHEPQIIKPELGVSHFTYPSPCEEFSLMVMRNTGSFASEMDFASRGPSICIVTEGEAIITSAEEHITLKQGESAFIAPSAADEAPLMLHWSHTVYMATCGGISYGVASSGINSL
jgi:mannose-6-phosphate isomerase